MYINLFRKETLWMKRYLVLLLIVLFTMCVVACGGDSEKSSTSSSQKTEVQKNELKSQDLKKMIPLAKMFTMNEQELREVEKIFSALGINVDNIEEWQGADYEVASVSGPHGLTRAIRVDLAPGKGQSFDFILSKKSRYLYLFFDLKNLFLAEYGQKSDSEVLFYNGKIYNKISDYLIDDSVRDKALHKATELAKKYFNKKGITDLKLSGYNFRVKSFATYKQGERKLFERRLNLAEIKYNDLENFSKYISGYAAFKGKEKYYGGENDVEVSIQNLHFDLQGNLVDPDLFNDATFFKDRNGIYNIPGNGGFKSTNSPAQAKETNNTKNNPNTSVPSEEHSKKSEGIITGDEVNVREGPGVNYKSLGVFFKGDKVRLVDISSSTKETWYKIEYDNPKAGLITGWVRSDYIKH